MKPHPYVPWDYRFYDHAIFSDRPRAWRSPDVPGRLAKFVKDFWLKKDDLHRSEVCATCGWTHDHPLHSEVG